MKIKGIIEDFNKLILLLVVILIIVLFVSSLSSFVYDNQPIKDFYNSEAFKTIIISIAVPLILFFLSTLNKGRELKQQEINERRKQREQELKNNRLKSIEKTFEEWEQINRLISQVRFCEGKNDPKLKDVQLKIAEQSISFGKLIYHWSERFPVIPDSIISVFVKYTATLYWGSWAVAYRIRNHDYEIKDVKELQESFGIFQRGVVKIAFINLVYVLKNSAKLLEYIEENERCNKENQVTIIDTIKDFIENRLNNHFGKNKEDSLLLKIYENKNKKFDKVDHNFIINQFLKYKKELLSGENIKKEIEASEQLKNCKIDLHIISIVSNLLKSAYILKMNELLLGIDLFWAGAITSKLFRTLRPFKSVENIFQSNNKGTVEERSSTEFRMNFEKIIDMIDTININDGKSPNDKVGNKENTYENLLLSDYYKNFVEAYYEMSSDKLLDAIADKSIEYIKIVGKTIRLETLIFSDDLSPVN